MSEQRTYKAFIFDLDGTLLHTLPDLVNVTNKALADQGFPPHTPEEIRQRMWVMELRVSSHKRYQRMQPPNKQSAFSRTSRISITISASSTPPNSKGSTAVLEQAKEAGVGLAILSNKFEQGVLDVRDRFFPDLIEVAHGESDAVPRKPDPTGLLLCASELGVAPEECLLLRRFSKRHASSP